MYSREDVETCQVWTHKKRGGVYHVLGISTCSTNGPRDSQEEVVVYFSMTYQKLRHRDVEQFLDGRFEPILPETA